MDYHDNGVRVGGLPWRAGMGVLDYRAAMGRRKVGYSGADAVIAIIGSCGCVWAARTL